VSEIILPQIEASAYAGSGDACYVKIHLKGLGFYVNSISVKPSPRYPEKGLWVQLPKYNVGGKWISPIEMNGNSHLWKRIEESCRAAAKTWNENEKIEALLDDFDFDSNMAATMETSI
jgi:hypothetical protein